MKSELALTHWFYFLSAIYSIGGISLFFLIGPLIVIALVSPHGLLISLGVAASYFLPLAIWSWLFAKRVGQSCKNQWFPSALFAVFGVMIGVVFAWLMMSSERLFMGWSEYVFALYVSFPTLILVCLFGLPIGVMSGLFFVGRVRRAMA